MIDVQNMNDERSISIDKVGIKDLRIPLQIKQSDGKPQNVSANVNIYVDLPENKKGTHMSRLIEIMNDYNQTPIQISTVKDILKEIKNMLDSTTAYIEMSFDYFIKKKAPVSSKESFLDYNCNISSMMNGVNSSYEMSVKVPISSLCPCSKQISKYGAHNQRGHVVLSIGTDELFNLEEIIKMVESGASCELYPLLKRPDEKYVTEKAYENPKFVEDIVRDVALKASLDKRIVSYRVSCENFESIHNHSAFAEIVSKGLGGKLNVDNQRIHV